MVLLKVARRFYRDSSGVVLVETLLVIPLLITVSLIIICFASIFHTMAHLERATRIASRELSLGRADDETNGVLTACSSLSGVSADGLESAEKLAFDLMGSLRGEFSVLASDTVAGGPTLPGNDIDLDDNFQNTLVVSGKKD